MPADRYLLAAITLGDVDDVEAFARSKLRRLPNGMFLRPDEHEDEIANVIEQLVDWFRPVSTPWCGAWSRPSPDGGTLIGPGCGHRRGEQHAWDCDALLPQRVRRSECLGCGVERHSPSVHLERCFETEDGKPKWGCFSCGSRRSERHVEGCEHRHERQQRYDPDRTSSFILFARFRLDTYYIPDLCRRLLGRNGGRKAERSHSELDERAESGRRPWEASAPEQDGLRAHLAAHAGGEEAGRDRARARGAALLGLRPA